MVGINADSKCRHNAPSILRANMGDVAGLPQIGWMKKECMCTRSWSTLKKAIWHGLLRRLAKAMKASASSKFRMRTAAMKDIP